MFKRIYTPIDNSDISDKVLSKAINLAKLTKAELRLVHIVKIEKIPYGIEMMGVDHIKQNLLENANQFIQHINRIIIQLEVKAEVVLFENYNNDVSNMLINDANAWDTDLFVLGSHHLGSLTHCILGGIVEDIARYSTTPILLVT